MLLSDILKEATRKVTPDWTETQRDFFRQKVRANAWKYTEKDLEKWVKEVQRGSYKSDEGSKSSSDE